MTPHNLNAEKIHIADLDGTFCGITFAQLKVYVAYKPRITDDELKTVDCEHCLKALKIVRDRELD